MAQVALRRPVQLLALALVAGPPVLAQPPAGGTEVKLGSNASFTIGGILSATLFLQDAQFGLGNGQQANFVTGELKGWWHGGDVRSTRLTLGFRGPEIADAWRANATLEADFFGGFNGAGAFGDEQPVPRLRLAYADFTNGTTTLRVGQAWALTLGNVPVSLSHIGFPQGWGSGGFIGWRFPGVFLFHSLSPATAATRAQLQFAVLKNSWSDEAVADQPSAGEAGTPQLEARLNVDGKTAGGGTWGLYGVTHWDRKDLNNVRAEGAPEPRDSTLNSWALEFGARVQDGGFTLHGNAYVGRAMGHHFAHVVQFGDIMGWGAWAQAGFDLTPRWSLWLYAGTERADEDDVRALTTPNRRINSWLLLPMLRYKVGPYSLGFEWLHNRTEYFRNPPATSRQTLKGNQLLFSTRYDF